MKSSIAAARFFALIFFASILAMPALAEELLEKKPGVYEKSFETEDLDLRFGLRVPGKKNGDDPRPLVLALHYGFDSSRPFPPYYGKAFMERVVSPGLKDLGAYIVSPDSHGMGWSDPKIVGPVLELLDALVKDPRIDGSKVIVTGYSMGGSGTWFFAANHGERFAAAVPMAGRLRAEWLDELGELPVFALYSEKDELVPHDRVRELVLGAEKKTIHFTSLPDITHFDSPKFARPLSVAAVPWLEEILAGVRTP